MLLERVLAPDDIQETNPFAPTHVTQVGVPSSRVPTVPHRDLQNTPTVSDKLYWFHITLGGKKPDKPAAFSVLGTSGWSAQLVGGRIVAVVGCSTRQKGWAQTRPTIIRF